MFQPKHTLQSVTKELIEGLEAGSIVLRPLRTETEEPMEGSEAGSVVSRSMAASKDLSEELDHQIGIEAMHLLSAAQVSDSSVASYLQSLPEAESHNAGLTGAWILVLMSRSSIHEE
jgi:hypothetical protein